MKQKTIAEIKQLLEQSHIDQTIIQELKSDQRVGVQKLVQSYEKKQFKHEQLCKQFEDMCVYEKASFDRGCQYVAGVDEAGRGPLAGPVVAAAVILPKDFRLIGLNDSKQLKAATRREFYDTIKQEAISYGIAAVDNDTIDKINIYEATKLAMTRAIEQLDPEPDHILIDAVPLNNLTASSESLIKGDCKSVSIAAASILAKVTRDQMMSNIHKEYPDYQFAANQGYGTKHHLNTLHSKGVTPYHRKSFAPVDAIYAGK
nr:ribonuclease HII [Lentibacillus saliphilus]